MAQITGAVTVTHDGKDYSLILGMSGLAQLQKEYGQDLKPLVEMEEEGKLPDFSVLVRITTIALKRFHPDADPYLADDLLRADPSVPMQVVRDAFDLPDDDKAAPSGNAARPRAKRKGAKRG